MQGTRIKYFRERQNLTKSELASKMGVTHTAVAKWESGKNYPKIKSLPKLAEVLNCNVLELLPKE